MSRAAQSFVAQNVPRGYWTLRLLAVYEGMALPGKSIPVHNLCRVAAKRSISSKPRIIETVYKVLLNSVDAGHFTLVAKTSQHRWNWRIRVTEKGREYYYSRRKSLWEMEQEK
jgi:hypothetical protein